VRQVPQSTRTLVPVHTSYRLQNVTRNSGEGAGRREVWRESFRSARCVNRPRWEKRDLGMTPFWQQEEPPLTASSDNCGRWERGVHCRP
jgi:hypothetical protein